MARRWPTRSAKTVWTISGCNRSTARVADRSPPLIRSRFSTSVVRRTAEASAYTAAIPTPTLSSSENRLNSSGPDIKIHAILGDRPHLSIHQETRKVNPRHLAALSLFLLFALDGTLRMAASPQTAQHFDAKLFQELRWRLIGPSRGGRALAVAGVRGQPEVFYFGSVGGGIWKTNDAGRTWNPIFDSEPIASIGAIAVAPSDSNVIYAGSGEADMRSSISYGNGMYKSMDGGKTWLHIGLEDSRRIEFLWRRWVMRTGRTRSAGCFVRKMGERAGKRFCFTMKTPERSIWRSSRGIRRRFLRHCGRREGRRGAFTRLRMDREADFIGRWMEAI